MSRNNVAAWERLLHFSARCLHVPTHSHSRISLATRVKSPIQDKNDPAPSTAKTNRRKSTNCPECEEDMLKSLSRRVSSKLEEAVFQPVAMETSGVIDPNSPSFLRALGSHLAQDSGEANSTACLLQRLSIAVQQGNAVATLGCASSSH